MNSENIVTGIDIGSDTIKIIVSEIQQDNTLPNILGIGTAPTQGMRHGYIVDLPMVTKSVSKALDNAVRSSRIRPSKAYLSIGGISLSGFISQGSAHIRHSDSTVTDSDLEHASYNATLNAEQDLINKKTLHDIPIAYHLDGKKALCDPIGMRATKLQTDLLLVNALESHIDDFVSAVEDAGVEVVDVTAAPLAASFASITTTEKMQGCILLDIGAESTDVIVFENNMPIALKVLPYGSNDITNAIALELKVSTTEAEQIKKGGIVGSKHNQNNINKVITKNIDKLSKDIRKLLKEINADIMLPAGALITGGGARLINTEDIIRDSLKLPTKTVYSKASKITGNPEFSVSYGLCIWGANNEQQQSVRSYIKNIFKKVSNLLKKLSP